MKVLILGFTKISYMPYLNFYLNQLRESECDIHLLYWKRDNEPDLVSPPKITSYEYKQYQEDSVPLKNKIRSFLGYRKLAKKILKKQRFDLIIVLHSTPGVLLNDLLIKSYKTKYILDYRDVTYEHLAFYKKIIHKLVSNSAATFVSSDAFRSYLPENKNVFTSHNILLDSLKNREIRLLRARDIVPIKIRYWGLLRHTEINLEIIKKLGNDERFELHYHGREQKTGVLLKQYCEENGFNNIFFHGEYMPEERYQFIKETDLIHNIFSNDKTMQSAMSNKYYDGVAFYIPQLCNINSYMGFKIEDKLIGKALDPSSKNFADEIHEYYNSIRWEDFLRNCDIALQKILIEYYLGTESIEKIINQKKQI